MSGADGPLADVGGWSSRVDSVIAECSSEEWELPDAETIPAPSAILIRPDGHVVWASDGTPNAAELCEAVTTWCGAASMRDS
jgi:3-(3-hydroxy-phenyl)propionate hydroxylase